MSKHIDQKAAIWLTGNYDEATKNNIRDLQANQPGELEESFYKNLEFGTGGLRGIMGVGTNRINKYTIGMATQGFANYLTKTYPDEKISVSIAHDSRNNSRFFAETTAAVFAANGLKVFLFETLRPTPELSFAIRHLGCKAGVVCTASHNPKEYNGYKAYWNDGGQLVPPHDKNVITEVEAIQSVDEVKWTGGESNIELLGSDMDAAYIKMVKSLSVYPEIIEAQKDLKIVYTPIHGTGITMVPQVLEAFGFTNVHIVEEQSTPDGNFPTVAYPNPEESETMSIGLAKAKLLGEKIGMAFQIKDDLFDYGDTEIGKPRGIDIKERKMTLPLIYTLNNCDPATRRKIINIVKNENDQPQKVNEVIAFVKKSGGLEYTEKIMLNFRNEAISILASMPAGEANQSLLKLIDYTIDRTI